MPAPELSIIIPVYNVADYIEQCLDSVINQTYTKWECILVDDGSQDWSGHICDNYAKFDSRFLVIHQDNKGVSAARNIGIKQSRGKYITFIDPDDFITTNYFDALMRKMLDVNADVAVSSFSATLENGEEGRYAFLNKWEKGIRILQGNTMSDNAAVTDALLNNVFSCVSWGKVYSKKLWGNALFPVGIDLGEDMMTVPRIIASAHSAVYVSEATYYWRQRKKSLLHGTVTQERYEKDLKASGIMCQQLSEVIPGRKSDIYALKLQYDLCCYFNFRSSNKNTPIKESILYSLTKSLLQLGGSENDKEIH